MALIYGIKMQLYGDIGERVILSQG